MNLFIYTFVAPTESQFQSHYDTPYVNRVMGANKISASDPTAAQDVATKNYADN